MTEPLGKLTPRAALIGNGQSSSALSGLGTEKSPAAAPRNTIISRRVHRRTTELCDWVTRGSSD